MKLVDEKDLKNVKGGFGFWGAMTLLAGITFISGILDGISRPKRCN